MTRLHVVWIAASVVACADVSPRGTDDDAGEAREDAALGAVDGATAADASVHQDDASTIDPDAGPLPPACPRVRVSVAAGEVLNVRPDPSTAMAPVGTLPGGAIVEVADMVHGETIDGVDLWYEIRSPSVDGFVFSAFAECTEDEIPPAPEGYLVPFACGARVRVTQGPGGGTSHTGRARYAYDFGVALETPIHAMAGGTVTLVRTSTVPGDPCYDGGGSECGPEANLVIVQHADGTTAAYKHINSASVSVGATVRHGDVLARSGSTGYSTGPHLHVEVRAACPTTIYCDTIPFTFADVGSPPAATTVTSGNCP
ncbi:MAG: peptidoglycan DD-metalloendopeptidase family protein [Myxococcota bacterium]|nr:peptidoglycan DD-metalloendopeptidase family protein [Myxococcota bacterium]